MESRKKPLSKTRGRPPRLATEEEKEALLLLVLLRLVELVEHWKRGVPKDHPETSPIKQAEAKAEKALCDFVRVTLSEGKKKRR